MLRPFLIFSLVSGTTAAFAAPVKLTGDDLKAKLNGALVEMDTPLGTKIPVRFGADGLVSGEAGDLAPLLGSAKDRGRWWIDGDRICSKWFRWFDAEPQCISVQQDGSRLYWREDGGKTGTATLVEEAPQQEPAAPKTVVAETEPVAGPTSPMRPTASQPKKTPEAIPSRQANTLAEFEPLPLPVRAPARASEVRVAVVPPAAGVSDAPETDAPVETATVAVSASDQDDISDIPMMRFGGAGLLEASARIAGATSPSAERAETEPSAVSSPAKPVAKAPAQKPKAQDTGVRVAALPQSSPAPAPRAKAVAHSPPAQDAAPAAAQGSPGASTASPAARDPWISGPSVRAPGLYRVRGVQRRDVLNVRRGPSEQHAAVAHIPSDGRRVQVTGACVGEWCPVRYRRATGWVHSFYLAEEQTRRGSASRVYLAQP